ncbi:MAG: heme peroxidase [Cyanobacteria bacterium RU_5_0]|nr:heme peroxidase [Cyanobacteria bacterium RU_5_0]
MAKGRSTANDGLRNQIEFFLLTNFPWFWAFVQSNDWLKRQVNKFLINSAIYKAKTRPYPLSTLTDYTSWDSLIDRTYSGRHLPPVNIDPGKLRSIDEIADHLFFRKGDTILSEKSTLLFPYFAQWFTDGFLRTSRDNNLKNTSNHDIDLSPLYGLNRQITEVLRSGKGGKLKSQFINDEEYLPYYFQDGVVKEEFKTINIYTPPELDQEKRDKIFAVGNERGNVQIGYVMMNTLFLREHNRICDVLAENYSTWKDEDDRLFQTARNIVIVLLIKIVIEEYINHIAPYHFKFIADPRSFTNEKWYRQNWMTLEFNLLYRWHSAVPNTVRLDGQDLPFTQTLWNNALLIDRGLGRWFEAASLQPAGRIGMLNTPEFLLETDKRSLQMGRDARLASYNDYREMCKFPRVTDFDQITENEIVQQELKHLYGDVDKIEFYVGLFAEDARENSAVGSLIGRLVGIDAFSQALTNPLLAENIFNETTFSPVGFEIIQTTQCLSDVLHRNIPKSDKNFKVTMTQVKA